jgi:hypothetical protein
MTADRPRPKVKAGDWVLIPHRSAYRTARVLRVMARRWVLACYPSGLPFWERIEMVRLHTGPEAEQ